MWQNPVLKAPQPWTPAQYNHQPQTHCWWVFVSCFFIHPLSGVHYKISCMLRHAPLQQIHAVNTKHSLLCAEPDPSHLIHLPRFNSHYPGATCLAQMAMYATLPLSSQGLAGASHLAASLLHPCLGHQRLRTWIWTEKTADRRTEWSECQPWSLKNHICHGI